MAEAEDMVQEHYKPLKPSPLFTKEDECLCELPSILINQSSCDKITTDNPSNYMSGLHCSNMNNCLSASSQKSSNRTIGGALIPHLQNVCGNRVHGFMDELKQVAQKISSLTDIDQELSCTLERLETQEEEITKYRQKVYKLEAEVKSKNLKIRDLERKLCDQNDQAQDAVKQAMCEVETAKCRIKQLEDTLDEQKRHNCDFNQRYDALKSKLKSSEKGAAYYKSLNASLEKTLESKRKIIEDLQQQTGQYLERLVEFEKARVSKKYLDQCDIEDQLHAAKMMIKEKDFEIAQLWENLCMLESAVCDNLNEIGIDRRNFTKDSLVAAALRHQKGCEQSTCFKSCCNNTDDCQQLMGMSGRKGKDCGSAKFEEVSKNLQNILKKITQLKQAHSSNRNCCQKAPTTPPAQCTAPPSVLDFEVCSCAK